MRNKKILSLILILTSILSCKKEQPIVQDDFQTGTIIDQGIITSFVQPISGSGGTMPNSKDLSYLMPPIRNQGNQGSCVAFALAYLKSYHESLEKGYSYTDDTKIMSPAFIFNQITQSSNCSGSNTIASLNLLNNVGVSTESEMPYDENSCSNKPNQTVIQNAYKNRIREWKGFDFQNNSDNQILSDIKYYINEMQPVIIDIHVDSDFKKLGLNTSTEEIWKFNLSGYVGYHTMIIVGYDDSKSAFKVWNSWPTYWGNDGWIWIDYNMFFRNVSRAYVTWDEFDNTSNGAKISSGTFGTDFGDCVVGNTKTQQVQITNSGNQSLNISNATTSNTNFSILSSFPINISSGQSKPISIKFSPTQTGAKSGNITLYSNAINASTFTFQINGNSVTQSNCNGFSWDFGPQMFTCTDVGKYGLNQYITGGQPPYSFYIDNVLKKTGSDNFIGECVDNPGTYNYKCVDANGCTITKAVTY